MHIKPLLLFSLPLLLIACANPHPPVAYPAGDLGQIIRTFHTADDTAAFHALQQLSEQDHPGQDGPPRAQRLAAIPALLQIVATDNTDRAIFAAGVIHELQPELLRTSPEFQRLSPRLVAALSRATIDDPKDAKPMRVYPLGAAFTLWWIGPQSYRNAFDPLARRFLAPVKSKIIGESDECWARYLLKFMLTSFGARAAPVFTRALTHQDPFVRTCALEGLAALGELAPYAPPYDDTILFSPADIAAARTAAHGAMPQIINRLWDDDESVRHAAATTIARVANASDASPRLIARLMDPATGSSATDALAALQPAATSQLLALAFDENRQDAQQSLTHIGTPAIPHILAHVDKDPSSNALAREILSQMDATALPALAAITHTDVNPAHRNLANTAYHALHARVSTTITRLLTQLDKFDLTSNAAEYPRNELIRFATRNAPAAAAALPMLHRLAASDLPPPLSALVKTAIDKISQSDQFPPDPP